MEGAGAGGRRGRARRRPEKGRTVGRRWRAAHASEDDRSSAPHVRERPGHARDGDAGAGARDGGGFAGAWRRVRRSVAERGGGFVIGDEEHDQALGEFWGSIRRSPLKTAIKPPLVPVVIYNRY